MSKTITPTKTYTAKALDAELGRRRNNKRRDAKAKAASFRLAKLTKADMDAIKNGEIVTVTFSTGRVEHIGLA